MWGWWRSKRIDLRKALESDLDSLRSTYFHLMASRGKPRGLQWSRIDWHDAPLVVREHPLPRWLALCPITVHFVAVEGGEMEGIEAVGLPRMATAVFVYEQHRWLASETVWFNLSPEEVIARAAGRYVPV